jgi:AAA+ superfamily predicted ATPase
MATRRSEPGIEIYPDSATHLHDELWRVWLLVEYHIRRNWETGVLPRIAEVAAAGLLAPDHLAALFRGAVADHTGDAHAPDDAGAGSQQVLDLFLRHNALVGERIAATLNAGRSLPLIEIARLFRLTQRQIAALTFALMPELDPQLLTAYRYLSQDPSCRGLDARLLATLVYDSPESRAFLSRDLSPRSPLLYYRLLEQEDAVGQKDSLLFRRLRPAARLVQMLSGDQRELDPELRDIAELRQGSQPGLFSDELVNQCQAALQDRPVLLVVQGQRGTGKRLIVQNAAAREHRPLLLVDGRQLMAQPPEVQRALLRALLRDLRLLNAVLVLPDIDDLSLQSGEQGEQHELPGFVSLLCREHPGPIVVTINGKRLPRMEQRPLVHVELRIPSASARSTLWRDQVASLPAADADALAERFAIPGGVIAMAAQAASASRLRNEGPPDADALDVAVRNQLHHRIMRSGRKLDTPYDFDELVVDKEVVDTLDEILGCVRERSKVRERWGFRGAQGVSVLFSGSPGVGKTLSATVLARQLHLAIYEIDLSRLVSKWLGETEKNLAEVFDAAEPGHVVLLFNEADSLFGKRTSEVNNANDRYANMETNYLLQRLEQFGGLAILTTNLTKAIDPAFRRRFAYDVQFAFPTAELRAELWRRVIPPQAEVAGLDFQQLAERFELSGGFIKVAAERAAFVAAAKGVPIDMPLIITAVERMYRERGKLRALGKLE